MLLSELTSLSVSRGKPRQNGGRRWNSCSASVSDICTSSPSRPAPVPGQRRFPIKSAPIARREKEKNLRRYLGRTFPVLLEGEHRSDNPNERTYSGYSPNFLRVCVPPPDNLDLANQIRHVRMQAVSATGESIEGYLA